MATINIGTSANDGTGTNWRIAWEMVETKLFETGKVLSDNNYTDNEQTKLAGIETGAQVNAANTVTDASYVHTDNNYSTTELNKVAFITPNIIAYTTSIPFSKALTDIATYTMIADQVFTINVAGAVDNTMAQVLLINNGLYTIDVTAFHTADEYDNTTTYTLLTFERKRGLYFVSILNLD